MMTLNWDLWHLLLLWAMWAVMMTGMMLPSASPLVLLYGAGARRSAAITAGRQIYALVAGYLVIWTVFSLGATVLQRALAALLLVSPMMEATSSRISATLLLVAGVYQLTPLKYGVPADVPVAPWIPDDPMAQRVVGCVPFGPRARRVLRGLLLGAHVAVVCRRGDELDRHRGADGICRL